MAAHDQGAPHGVTADPDIQLHNVPLLHEFVHCPLNEVPCVPLAVYAHNSQLTQTVDTPGSEPSTTAVGALPDTLQVLPRSYQCVWRMHRSGLSLRGEFGTANILVYSTLAVRLTGVHLSRFTKSDGDRDYAQFTAAVEEMFALHESLPDDIRTWLGRVSMATST
ncbi:uncharacterized protein LOC120677365 isoform X3 [Panicum virgatum]|uniref:uncharacterized protein LOC120677365 isoform X2 n=1 Tax=Panicum virgatum TaxID=38727 RepID=UPI0019D5BECA|nr:uncharacterized protein LOC120677365 isoform X2 [Panicum virgatum]XP_039814454.1 uncharacterized protein LOC120677365 isoform X3 [Panicum virgatum]